MRDALKRALVAKMAANANTSAAANVVAPANAVTPAKHWWARDYLATAPAPATAVKATVSRTPRHVVAVPGRASYESNSSASQARRNAAATAARTEATAKASAAAIAYAARLAAIRPTIDRSSRA